MSIDYSELYKKLEADLNQLLDDLKGVLSQEELAEIKEFVDHGEYGVAFEELCGIAEKQGYVIPMGFRPAIASLAQSMSAGLDADCWKYLKSIGISEPMVLSSFNK
jgi:hypothetical protein